MVGSGKGKPCRGEDVPLSNNLTDIFFYKFPFFNSSTAKLAALAVKAI